MQSLRTLCRIASLAFLACLGCASTSSSDTARTGMEQLLISNAIDQSLDKVDFKALAGQSVYIEEKYLDCTDQKYLMGALRHRLLYAGASVADTAEAATVALEVRSGGVGTDRAESFIGMPEIAVPGPVPVALPEIRLFERSRQTGTAKIGIVAYDTNTKQPLGAGGHTLARSDDNNWYVLGMGPYRQGSVRSEVSTSLSRGGQAAPLPMEVALRRPVSGPADRSAAETDTSRVQLTGSVEAEEPPFAPAEQSPPEPQLWR